MNAIARKVHRIVVGFGVVCAVAAALPCVAEDKPVGLDTVTVEGKVIPPPVIAKKSGKSAPAEENIGLISGLAIGAVAGGPIGAVAGAITGALLGEHYHKQKVANHDLAADLSGTSAEKAQLTQTVMQLDGSLDHARELTVNISFKTGDANLTPDDIDQLTRPHPHRLKSFRGPWELQKKKQKTFIRWRGSTAGALFRRRRHSNC